MTYSVTCILLSLLRYLLAFLFFDWSTLKFHIYIQAISLPVALQYFHFIPSFQNKYYYLRRKLLTKQPGIVRHSAHKIARKIQVNKQPRTGTFPQGIKTNQPNLVRRRNRQLNINDLRNKSRNLTKTNNLVKSQQRRISVFYGDMCSFLFLLKMLSKFIID